jgi:hypothetical protein
MSDEHEEDQNEILLSLASDNQVLTEIMKRFDHAAFCGMKTGVSGKNHNMYIRRWRGNAHTIIGLATDLGAHVLDDYRMTSEGMDEEFSDYDPYEGLDEEDWFEDPEDDDFCSF